jgi:hypothetical protein
MFFCTFVCQLPLSRGSSTFWNHLGLNRPEQGFALTFNIIFIKSPRIILWEMLENYGATRIFISVVVEREPTINLHDMNLENATLMRAFRLLFVIRNCQRVHRNAW